MRGHIKKRSKGSWSVVIDLGRDPVTGKRKQKWHTVKGTKRDAERFLADTIQKLNAGVYTEPSKMKLGEYFDLTFAITEEKVAPSPENQSLPDLRFVVIAY